MEFIPAKTIISGYADGGSRFGDNYNMNIYKGCCHGCIYCDSRSERYRIEDFDQVRAKDNAVALIALELIDAHGFGISIATKSDLVTPHSLQAVLRHQAACCKRRFLRDPDDAGAPVHRG